MKTDVIVRSKSNMQKDLFFVSFLKATDKKAKSRIRKLVAQFHGSTDPDLHQNITDPQIHGSGSVPK